MTASGFTASLAANLKEQPELRREEFIAKIRNNAKHDRLALPKGRKVALSFREAAAKYLDRLKESGGKDLSAKARRLKLHLIPFFGDTPLSKITTFNIEQYKRRRCTETDAAKSGTVNRELAVLSHLFNNARVIYLPKAKAGAREQPITKHLADFLAGYLAALPQSLWLFPSIASKHGHLCDIKRRTTELLKPPGLTLNRL